MRNFKQSLVALAILTAASVFAAPAMAGTSLCKAKLTVVGYNVQSKNCGLEFNIYKGEQKINSANPGAVGLTEAQCRNLCNNVNIANPAPVCGAWNDYVPRDCSNPQVIIVPVNPNPNPNPNPAPNPTPAPNPSPAPKTPVDVVYAPAAGPVQSYCISKNLNTGAQTVTRDSNQTVCQSSCMTFTNYCASFKVVPNIPIEATYTPATKYCVLKNMATNSVLGTDSGITQAVCQQRCDVQNSPTPQCMGLTVIGTAPALQPSVISAVFKVSNSYCVLKKADGSVLGSDYITRSECQRRCAIQNNPVECPYFQQIP